VNMTVALDIDNSIRLVQKTTFPKLAQFLSSGDVGGEFLFR
jgi:hypothetical protein